MHKILIIEAFNKAKKIRVDKGDLSPSLVSQSEDISNFVFVKKAFRLGERSFRDYYKDAKNKLEEGEDININQLKVVEGLCEFLDFEDYKEFKSSLPESQIKPEGSIVRAFIKKRKRELIIAVIVLLVLLGRPYFIGPQWMEWQDDRYVEVEFDAKKLSQGKLKVYKLERIDNFRKITADCETEIFNEDGSENLWYGKNAEGELEYFTDLAKHPETDKSLKPITEYMFKKYICDTYK